LRTSERAHKRNKSATAGGYDDAGNGDVTGVTAPRPAGRTPRYTAFAIASEASRLKSMSDATDRASVPPRGPDWHMRFGRNAETVAR
jgi:hypothetical protein